MLYDIEYPMILSAIVHDNSKLCFLWWEELGKFWGSIKASRKKVILLWIHRLDDTRRSARFEIHRIAVLWQKISHILIT
ncbi:hypothetical protein EYC80_008564 [Monilinia laxa]|uniref:Uncharacterized protein n=1 Tax=Monilinia laxa TaxID=61186 RepID=A0A5N6K151_MONLA|nr:hypothetical protein EYC80_008564 [Monilinia laxa]